jgi:hypothetical protein
VIVFVDFEASSLGKRGFPIEVGWTTDTGLEEAHLIHPAPGWEEWSADAAQIHGLSLDYLRRDGIPHYVVARRMVEVLSGHLLYASAPSWDGQWLSRLLRAAGLPRHALRLRDTEEARRAAALEALKRARLPQHVQEELLADVLAWVQQEAKGRQPAHRALGDARQELWLWRAVQRRASDAAARWWMSQRDRSPEVGRALDGNQESSIQRARRYQAKNGSV